MGEDDAIDAVTRSSRPEEEPVPRFATDDAPARMLPGGAPVTPVEADSADTESAAAPTEGMALPT
jgi:hypothetical protein